VWTARFLQPPAKTGTNLPSPSNTSPQYGGDLSRGYYCALGDRVAEPPPLVAEVTALAFGRAVINTSKIAMAAWLLGRVITSEHGWGSCADGTAQVSRPETCRRHESCPLVRDPPFSVTPIPSAPSCTTAQCRSGIDEQHRGFGAPASSSAPASMPRAIRRILASARLFYSQSHWRPRYPSLCRRTEDIVLWIDNDDRSIGVMAPGADGLAVRKEPYRREADTASGVVAATNARRSAMQLPSRVNGLNRLHWFADRMKSKLRIAAIVEPE